MTTQHKKRSRSPSPQRGTTQSDSTNSRKKLRVGESDTPAPPHLPTLTTMTTPTPTPAPSHQIDPQYAEFLRFLESTGGDPLPPLQPLVSAPTSIRTVTITPSAPATVSTPKPKNPFAHSRKLWNNTANFLKNFPTGHDSAHFLPTPHKTKHGVWAKVKRSEVKEWIGLALDSIYNDDRFVANSKPGTGASKGGYNYLVFMDGQTVGYISGSLTRPGEEPETQHIAIYVGKSGYPVSAFPCAPDMF
jgi:hypothetical protein